MAFSLPILPSAYAASSNATSFVFYKGCNERFNGLLSTYHSEIFRCSLSTALFLFLSSNSFINKSM